MAGALAIILLLYMSATLPLNIAGVALVILAVALFALDIFAPTHGVLTVGGIVAFFLLGAHAHAVQSRAGRVSFARDLGDRRYAGDRCLFHFFREQRHPRPVFAHARRRRNHDWQTISAQSPIRFKRRAGLYRRGNLERREQETPIEAGQNVEVTGLDGLTLKVKPKTS